MPYLSQESRDRLEEAVIGIESVDLVLPGDMNYLFTKIVRRYIFQHGLSYRNINDVMGAFDAAGKEFYRRIAVPYEDKKIEENGDVY